MKIDNFIGTSIRGLTAYGICCLESALLHFNLQDDEGWRFLLENFWLYTALPESLRLGSDGSSKDMKDLECLQYFFDDSSPYQVIREVEGKKIPNERRIRTYDAEKIPLLYEAYSRADKNVLKIRDAVESLAFTEFNGWSDYPTYMTLDKLDILLEIMEESNIPLPEVERFNKYRLDFDPPKNIAQKYEAKAWGPPFNGQQELSQILK